MTPSSPSPSLEVLLEGWVVAYGVSTALVTGDAIDAAAALTRHVGRVVVAVPNEAEARLAERALGGMGAIEVRVGRDAAALPRCDLVLTVNDLARRSDWASEVAALAERAARVLVVALPNPRAVLSRLAGHARAPVCRTDVVAPLLWAAGRVREHVYFGGPSLPSVGPLASLPASLPRLHARLAAAHAFVVDTAPRTPQARRRLHTV